LDILVSTNHEVNCFTIPRRNEFKNGGL
jgi:hypothetical protein